MLIALMNTFYCSSLPCWHCWARFSKCAWHPGTSRKLSLTLLLFTVRHCLRFACNHFACAHLYAELALAYSGSYATTYKGFLTWTQGFRTWLIWQQNSETLHTNTHPLYLKMLLFNTLKSQIKMAASSVEPDPNGPLFIVPACACICRCSCTVYPCIPPVDRIAVSIKEILRFH